MDISDYRILQFLYLILESTKIERQQMFPFQFRRLIIEALQSRQYKVTASKTSERIFTIDRLVLLFFPYNIESDDTIRKYLLEILNTNQDNIGIAYAVRNGLCACILRIQKPNN